MTPTRPKTEDGSRGQRSGEGSNTALTALRRDERRRRNIWSDSVLPSELPPVHEPLVPSSPAEPTIPRRFGKR